MFRIGIPRYAQNFRKTYFFLTTKYATVSTTR